jgi:hypothetical protein
MVINEMKTIEKASIGEEMKWRKQWMNVLINQYYWNDNGK